MGRYFERIDRRDLRRVPGHGHGMCALPQPQIRSHFAARLFLLTSVFCAAGLCNDIPVLSAEKRAEYERQQANWEHLTADIRHRLDELQPTILGKDASKFPEDMQTLLRKPSNQRNFLRGAVVPTCDAAERHAGPREPAASDKKTCTELLKELENVQRAQARRSAGGNGRNRCRANCTPTSIPGTRNAENLQPGFPEVLGVPTPPIQPSSTAPHSTGRRIVFARWIASADNPLTA